MIERKDGFFVLVCDCCGDEDPEIFYSYRDAINSIGGNGWQNQRCGDGWQDVCPDCRED